MASLQLYKQSAWYPRPSSRSNAITLSERIDDKYIVTGQACGAGSDLKPAAKNVLDTGYRKVPAAARWYWGILASGRLKLGSSLKMSKLSFRLLLFDVFVDLPFIFL